METENGWFLLAAARARLGLNLTMATYAEVSPCIVCYSKASYFCHLIVISASCQLHAYKFFAFHHSLTFKMMDYS